MTLAHFYHCWCGGLSEPYEEHVQALVDGGFDGPITVGLVGTPEEREPARELFDSELPGCSFVEFEEGHEEVTLRLVHEFVNQDPPPTGAVLYAHTHGSWHPQLVQDRSRITHGLIVGWRRCLGLLSEAKVDLVGYACVRTFRSYSGHALLGHFWMASCEYLRTLPRPVVDASVENIMAATELKLSLERSTPTMRQRIANENWILEGRPFVVWPEASIPKSAIREVTL